MVKSSRRQCSSQRRQFQQHYEGNCHPRGALLAEIVRRAGPSGVKSREVRSQLAVIRKTLTVKVMGQSQRSAG
jgi:hypothetical protein